MSRPIAWRRSWAGAGAGAVMAAADSMAARILRRIGGTSSAGRKLDHVEQGFEMGIRQDEPPAIVADPLDHARHVALGVPAVAQGKRLVADLEGAEIDLAATAFGKQHADRSLRPVEPAEMKSR